MDRTAWHRSEVKSEPGADYSATVYAEGKGQTAYGSMRGWAAHSGEEHDVGFQQGDGDVPGVVGLPQELNELRGNLGLRLAQRDAFEQRLHKHTLHDLLSGQVAAARLVNSSRNCQLQGFCTQQVTGTRANSQS